MKSLPWPLASLLHFRGHLVLLGGFFGMECILEIPELALPSTVQLELTFNSTFCVHCCEGHPSYLRRQIISHSICCLPLQMYSSCLHIISSCQSTVVFSLFFKYTSLRDFVFAAPYSGNDSSELFMVNSIFFLNFRSLLKYH